MTPPLRTIFITGATSGLGRALAETLTHPDTFLILTGQTPAELAVVGDAVHAAGGQCETHAFDIRSATAVAERIADVASRRGGIDVLINNAGWAHKKIPTEDLSVEDYRRTMETNLDGVFFCIKAVLPLMKKAGHGLIVNIASLAGKRGHGGLADYAASKFGVMGLTQSVGWELRDANLAGMRIVAVCPGGINTPMRAAIFNEEDAARQQSPEAVAKIIRDIIEGTLVVQNGGDVEIRNGTVTATNDPLSG